jgi:hypothetical protein
MKKLKICYKKKREYIKKDCMVRAFRKNGGISVKWGGRIMYSMI